MATTANTPPPGKTPGAAPGKPPARPATLAPEYTTGAELQTLREAAGLSREALAELVGVQARTVKHWEHGRAGVPADVAEEVGRWAYLPGHAARVALMHAVDTPHTSGVTLLRYRQTSDLHPTDQSAGMRTDVHGAAVTMTVQFLALEGVSVRVVWFDVDSFTVWRQLNDTTDTHAARLAWANRVALPTQAIPPRGTKPQSYFAQGYDDADTPTTQGRSRP